MGHTNRLAQETSPYLLQHAHNPVDWYAWGPEAFEAARTQNKPIFLSVGYSTCYWCHVMERQCFEVEAIAKEMNDRFINIKVDREERPDVDQLYMTAVQLLTRHGGWPMSVFLLPDLRPFYGGTYFPPNDTQGRPGFVTILRAIQDAYKNRTDDVKRSAAQIVNILHQLATPPAPSEQMTIDQSFIAHVIDRSTSDYDSTHGGFGAAPKFPRETLLELLLAARGCRGKNDEAKIRKSLDALANGGIRDHLGGGFHRYSTDAEWLVPHFEIMLYDNAMLAWIYVEAYRQFDEPRYARIARGIFDFVLREMTSPEGAFYTALDAEVDAMEGGSYLWTAEQVEEVLGKEDAAVFAKAYGVDRGPNFADPHHGHDAPDQNVLFLPDGPAMEDDPRIIAMRQKLLDARKQRKQPLLDTKVITSWNALMIRALAHGADILGAPLYLAAARRAASFLLEHHLTPDGALNRTSRNGVKKHDGFLDDYAFLAQAFLSLHRAGAGDEWKGHASKIAQEMVRRFADESLDSAIGHVPEARATGDAPATREMHDESDPNISRGGFFFTSRGASDLIVRQKVAGDSPLPSGNAIAAMVLLELDQPVIARNTIACFAAQLDQQGEGMSAMVQAALMYVERHGPINVTPHAESSATDRPLPPGELAKRVVGAGIAWHDPQTLEVGLNILKPFHINAHDASPGQIPTELRVSGREVVAIEYPSGHDIAFGDRAIRVYDGQTSIIVRLKQASDEPLRIALRYQACDESACLPEVIKEFTVTAPSIPDAS